jgi:AcrR family transcriptional regulator
VADHENVVRKPRADAERNRTRLLETAKAAFAENGSDTNLDAIARAAGVGIGTLYRHFPTRDALIEAVYRNETTLLAEAATRLTQTHAPMEALREWMLLFVDYMETKQGISEALNSIVGGTSELYAISTEQMREAIKMLLDRATTNGAVRVEMDPFDLLRAVAGVAYVGAGPDWKQASRRMVDIVIAGISTKR